MPTLDTRVTIRLDDDLLKELEEKCPERNRSESIRRAVKVYLAELDTDTSE